MGGADSRDGSSSAHVYLPVNHSVCVGWLQTSWLSQRAAGQSHRAEKTTSDEPVAIFLLPAGAQPAGPLLIGSSASHRKTRRMPSASCGDEMVWEGFRPPPSHPDSAVLFSVALRGEEELKAGGKGKSQVRGGWKQTRILSGLYCSPLVKSAVPQTVWTSPMKMSEGKYSSGFTLMKGNSQRSFLKEAFHTCGCSRSSGVWRRRCW